MSAFRSEFRSFSQTAHQIASLTVIGSDDIFELATRAQELSKRLSEEKSHQAQADGFQTLKDGIERVFSTSYRSKKDLLFIYYILFGPTETDSILIDAFDVLAKRQKDALMECEDLFITDGTFEYSSLAILIKRLNERLNPGLVTPPDQKETDPKELFRKSAFRALHTQKVKSQSIEGYPTSKSLMHFISDLKEFQDLAAPFLKTLERETFRWIEQKMSQALHFSVQQDRMIHFTKLHPDKKEALTQELSYMWFKAMMTLEIGDEVVMPCGYHTYDTDNKISGHTILVVAKRVADQGQLRQFSLTLINTGEGALDLDSMWVLGINLLLNKGCDYHIHEISETDLLQSEVLVSIMKWRFPERGRSFSTNDIYRSIGEALQKSFVCGRRHDLQINGTCAASSVKSWIESKLSLKLYYFFELFLKNSSVDYLAYLLQNAGIDSNQSLIEDLQGEFEDPHTQLPKILKGIAFIQAIHSIGVDSLKQLKTTVERELILDEKSVGAREMEIQNLKRSLQLSAAQMDIEFRRLHSQGVNLETFNTQPVDSLYNRAALSIGGVVNDVKRFQALQLQFNYMNERFAVLTQEIDLLQEYKSFLERLKQPSSSH